MWSELGVHDVSLCCSGSPTQRPKSMKRLHLGHHGKLQATSTSASLILTQQHHRVWCTSKHCLAFTQKRLSDNRQRCLRIQNVPPCNPEQSRTLPVCAQNTHVRSRTPYRSNQPHPLVVFLVLDVVATCKQFSPWKRRINRHISHKCYLEISLGNLNSNRSNHC